MKTILLVEDDPFLIDIYSTKLKKAGFKVGIVKDGGMVFKKIKEIKPDLILLDIVLPNFDGWEILRQFHGVKNNSKFKQLKIIILSNLGQRSDIKKGLSLGAAKYLIKARYTPSQVVEEIKKIL